MFNYTIKLNHILKLIYYFTFIMAIFTSHTHLKEDNEIYISCSIRHTMELQIINVI